MKDFYEKVRKDNVVKYGTRVSNYIPIIINQYSDRTHFIFEIIQNAEDAGATYIKFHLYKEKLVIYHNGRPFDEKDVIGVCGIADGTKADGTRIGHFGIGFKAIYGYTATPHIYSGDICFKIVEYLNPYKIVDDIGVMYEETCLVLPFDKPNVPTRVAFDEIREALTSKISAESIIMLNSITDLEISIDGDREIRSINKEKGAIRNSSNAFEISLLTTYENKKTRKITEEEANYIFFTDAEKRATAIAFKVKNKEIIEIKNNRVYAFFPMAVESHQSFLIHAPFDTNPARNEILQGTEYGRNNNKYIKSLCKLIRKAIIWLRDNGYLSLSGLNKIYPIYKYDVTNVLYPIYESSVGLIAEGEEILPTNLPGEFKSVENICIPENMGITDVFTDEDLKDLCGNRRIYWISKQITTKEFISFKSFLDENFNISTYEWRHLVLKLNKPFLERKPVSWIALLMQSIEGFCVKRGAIQSHFIDVSRIPLVRLTDGKHICARENGRLLVYLNNPSFCMYKINADFLKMESIRSFLEKALNIPVYDTERETIDRILPKYANKNVEFNTDNPIKENIEDLSEVKEAIASNPSIVKMLEDKYIVTDGKEWYTPGELHIQSNDKYKTGYFLVKGIVELKFLADTYYDDTVMSIKLDDDFFRKIGCSFGLRQIRVSKSDYLRAVSKYIDNETAKNIKERVLSKTYISEKWNWAFNFEGFPEAFESMTPQKSRDIARFLNGHIQLFDIQGELVGANDQHFSGSGVDSVGAYSMIGLILCFEKWVYINGNAEPFRPIDVDKEDLISGYEPSKRLIGNLPFKEVKNALYEYLETVFQNKGDIELVRGVLSKPEDVLEYAKFKAKSDAKIVAQEKKKSSLLERYKNADKAQVDTGRVENEELEVSPISEKGLNKRKDNLEKELIDSLGNKTKVARGLVSTIKRCNNDEKIFLEAEYGGMCQICQKKIKKWNGEYYFEAINIIKPHELYDNVISSRELGWNALSLCPNCAAEYNYCSKKISSFYDQVMEKNVIPDSDDPIEIYVEIPEGKQRRIVYSPRHFLALKTAFEVYAKEE